MEKENVKTEKIHSYVFDITRYDRNEYFITIPEWDLRMALEAINDRKKDD